MGEIASVDPEIIRSLLKEGFTPVIAPIGSGEEGETYNINADLVAGKIAEILKAEKLVLMTNTPGVLDKAGNLLTGLTARRSTSVCRRHPVWRMLPRSALLWMPPRVASNRSHHRCRVPNSLLLEILTSEGVGTMIRSH